MTKEEYKEKLTWLNTIPKAWAIKPLCAVAKEKSVKGSNGELLSVYLDRGVIRASDGSLGTHAPSEEMGNYQVIEPGDFILNNQQAWRGSVGVSFEHGIISPAYLVLGLSEELDWIYSNYLLRARPMVDQFMLASQGVGSIQRQVHAPSFKNVLTIVPPLETQKSIAAFLDERTKAVDELVAKKEKMIELLREKRQSLITQVVTKGLDPDVKMKRSGLQWAGQIPDSWEIYKLRNVLISGIVDGPHETPLFVDEGIPFISVDSIEDDERVNLDVVRKFISEDQYTEYNKKTKLTPNDILFTKAASIGKVAIVDSRKFMTWSPLAILKPNPTKVLFKYLYYLLKSDAFIEYVKNNANFNTQLNIGMKVLERSMIVIPKDLDTQKKITEYLDIEASAIQEAIFLIESQITLLRQYRTSLIYSTVTGKIKI